MMVCHNTVHVSNCRSPVGFWSIGYCREGAHYVRFLGENCDIEEINGECDSNVYTQFFEKYFFCKSKERPPEICWASLNKSAFIAQVLKTLLERVHFGEIVSYKKLAEMCGNSKSSRAVGMAMKKNPLPIVIPCHRIIRSDGQFGNYMSDKYKYLKSWLIKHES